MQKGRFGFFCGRENGSSVTLRGVSGDDREERRRNIGIAADFHSEAQLSQLSFQRGPIAHRRASDVDFGMSRRGDGFVSVEKFFR